MSRPPGSVDFGKNPFEFKKTETYGHLILSGTLDGETGKEFEKRIRPQLDGFSSHLIIDLSGCDVIHHVWSRLLMQLAVLVKDAQKKIRVISTNNDHRIFFKNEGLSPSFPFSASLGVALEELGITKKQAKLDVNFINPFLEGAIQVLKVQVGVKATSGTLTGNNLKVPLIAYISGVIGLESDNFTGSVVISFPTETYLKIMSKMMRKEFKSLQPEIENGAADIAKAIFGYAKRVLDEKGYGIKSAVPSVRTGKDAHDAASKGPRIGIPFESDAGAFFIEICVGAT